VRRIEKDTPSGVGERETVVELTRQQEADLAGYTNQPMWLLSGGVVTEEMPPRPVAEEIGRVPDVVPLWRIRAVAKQAGIYDLVVNAIAGLPEAERIVAEEVWASGTVLDRRSAILQGLAKGTGLTRKQVDGLFRKAARLRV